MCLTASGGTHVLCEVNVIIGNTNDLIIVFFPKIVKSPRFHNNLLIFLSFSSQFFSLHFSGSFPTYIPKNLMGVVLKFTPWIMPSVSL